MRLNSTFKKLIWGCAFAFFLVSAAQAYAVLKIVPFGKIKVYKEGKLVQVLKETAPVPKGATLSTEGNCGVRMSNLYLVAKDGSVFSIQENSKAAELKIEKGLLMFAVTPRTGRILFQTPAGSIDTRQIRIQASGGPAMLKGYLDVTDGTTKMGVLDGGSLVVSTPEGDQVISEGKQIILAQANLVKNRNPSTIVPAVDTVSEAYYAAAAALLGAGGGAGTYSATHDDDDGGDGGQVSRSTP